MNYIYTSRYEREGGIHMGISRTPRLYTSGVRALATWLVILGRVAPSLAAGVACRRWFSPYRFRLPPRERVWLNAARREYVSSLDNGMVALYRWGHKGPRVLLVHGWNGRATQLCGFIEPLLQAGYQVIAFDAPAHGHSPGKRTDLIEIAHALRSVSVRFGPFEGVIAHSFGMAVTAYALRHLGVATHRVVGISPPGRMPYLFNRFCELLHLPHRAREAFEEQVMARFGKDVWEQLSPEANVELLENIPALLIHDNDDCEVTPGQAEILHQAWPGSHLLRTAGLGHRRILRDPAVIAHTVRFFQRGQIPETAE
ncbi:MAG: alpha/beta fold hydrolase [Pseudomonadota bacterium]